MLTTMDEKVAACCNTCMSYQFSEDEFLDSMDWLADYFEVGHGFVASQIEGTIMFPMFEGDAAELEYRLKSGGVYVKDPVAGPLLPPREFSLWAAEDEVSGELQFWDTVLFEERVDRARRRLRVGLWRLGKRVNRFVDPPVVNNL